MRNCGTWFKREAEARAIEAAEDKTQYPEKRIEVVGDKIVVTDWKSSGTFNPISEKGILEKIIETGIEDIDYQVFVKPSIYQKKAETKEQFKLRQSELITQTTAVERAIKIPLENAKMVLENLNAIQKLGRSMEKNVWACVGYGICPFYKDCWGMECPTTKEAKTDE